MKIQPTDNIHFGIYKCTKKTSYGFVNTGVFKNKTIDIYNAFYPDGTLKHKLYYVVDMSSKWVKSKLKFFKDGKCYFTARSNCK